MRHQPQLPADTFCSRILCKFILVENARTQHIAIPTFQVYRRRSCSRMPENSAARSRSFTKSTNDVGSNSVRRHEFAYTESGTRTSYLGGSLVKRARGFFIGVDVFSFRCAFNVGFGILLAAALIVRIRFFCACAMCVDSTFFFFISRAMPSGRASE